MFIDTEAKYSPKNINEYVFPNKHVENVVKAYASGKVTRPLILSGTNGTGKSLLADLIPKAIEGFTPQVNNVKAKDLNSDKEVIAQFTYNKHFNKLFTVNRQRFNYNVIQEVNFDVKARDAFRTVLDDYRGTDLTIMTTNEITKVDKGVRSRCEVLEVPAVSPELFLPHAKKIFEAEGVSIDEGALYEALEAVYDEKPDNREYYKKIDELFREVGSN